MCNICHKGVFHHKFGAVTQIAPCPNGCRRATLEDLDTRLEIQMQQVLAAIRESVVNAG